MTDWGGDRLGREQTGEGTDWGGDRLGREQTGEVTDWGGDRLGRVEEWCHQWNAKALPCIPVLIEHHL